jgi:hypothetical protein
VPIARCSSRCWPTTGVSSSSRSRRRCHPATTPTLSAIAAVAFLLLAAAEAGAQLLAGAALVGVGRLYQLKDDDRDWSGVVHRGVSSTILRYGGGLQLRF